MKHSLPVNAAVLAALKVAAPLLSLLVVLAVSRRLGAEGLGRYSLAYAYLSLFGLLGLLGLPPLLTREGARDPAALGRLLSSGMVLGGGVSVVLGLAMMALSRTMDYDEATFGALAVISLALAPATWMSYCDAAFLALERTSPMALGALAEHALKAGLGILLLYSGYGLPGVLAAAVMGKVAACVVSILLLRRLGVPVVLQTDLPSLHKLTGQAPVFALSAICATLYWRVDVFLLSRLRGMTEVGYYTAAYRILDIAILAPQSLCHALYPRLAGRNPLGHGAAMGWLVLLTAPVALGIAVLSGRVLSLLYGAEFVAAESTLAILIWTAVPYAWNRYHAYWLVAMDRQEADLGINAGSLAANLGLNLALIPHYGARGAALVTLATAVLYGAAQLTYLRTKGLRLQAVRDASK